MHRGISSLAAMLLIVVPAGTMAQPVATIASECPAEPAPLPAELASWSTPQPIVAGTGDGAATPLLKIGHTMLATLSPTPRFRLAPEKAGEDGNLGGLFGFTVAEAGTYQVALGAKAWIDVVKGKVAVASTAHGHGPQCSGIRKIVDFDLKPGAYVLQLSGAATDTLQVLVTKRP